MGRMGGVDGGASSFDLARSGLTRSGLIRAGRGVARGIGGPPGLAAVGVCGGAAHSRKPSPR